MNSLFNNRFAMFLVLSLLAHSPLVLFPSRYTPLFNNQSASEGLTVKFETADPKTKHAKHKNAAPRIISKRAALNVAEPEIFATPKIKQLNKPSPDKHIVSTGQPGIIKYGSTDSANSKYISKLKNYLSTIIQPDFRYPLIARKNGWEGNVLLSMHITHEGHINNIQIQKSSGYPVLDRNALYTIEKTGRIHNKNFMLVMAADIELPIEYRLEK